ncbi:calcium-binding protein 39-like [Dermatophagoides pteronyssinus]|uniref:calcium-binding protein 39-like n=1 Tax=Dermatophagoides pteronyssinus TaxID=6956 RepID=UPI003F67EB5C
MMRLLKQISLDSHSPINLSYSLHSLRFHYHAGTNPKFNSDFGKHLAKILDRNVRLLNLINWVDQIHNNDGPLLKALESLNSCIVTLIEMCEFTKTLHSTNIINIEAKEFATNNNYEKQKSKLRRHYSAFVDGGQLFRSKRSSSLLLNNINDKDPTLTPNESIYIESIIENSIHKLIESNILNLLVDSIPNIGFEEKKLARIILTNSLTIDVKNNKIIVEYFCDSSNQILHSLVKSYEYGKSDVTLNCGCILRFAAQFEPIIFKILQSNFFHNFFDYMRQSSSYPFDVTMDVFYTFKTLMSKHKKSTTEILVMDSDNFFESLIKLLEHAELTEDYVTKRQTLEVLTEIFSGPERFDLREKFIIHQDFICSVIRYLWNRNIQIRLRCLALISQFSRYPLSTIESSDEEEESEDNVAITNVDNSCSWSENSRMDGLIEKIRTTFIETHLNIQYSDDKDSQIKKNLNELKNECQKSNVKKFEQLICFIDQLIQFLDCN